jgi:hypothetical protein
MNVRACLLLVMLGVSSVASADDKLVFAIWETGAFFTISPDGRLDVAFGSTPGDHAYLPAGSVDYQWIRALLPSLQDSAAVKSGVVAIAGEKRMRSPQESAVLIYVVCSNQNAWRLDEFGDRQRVRALLQKDLAAPCLKLQSEIR